MKVLIGTGGGGGVVGCVGINASQQWRLTTDTARSTSPAAAAAAHGDGWNDQLNIADTNA